MVAKRTAYRLFVEEEQDARITRLLKSDDPSVRRMRRSHEEHEGTVEEVARALDALGADVEWIRRAHAPYDPDGAALVVTVGGDGTLLAASHRVGRTPIVGVNSAPSHSVGFFCGVKKGHVHKALRQALEGKLRAVSLSRMSVHLNGKVISTRVLNDALFCHRSPAATTRYILRFGRVVEEQKSSGFWIGPAAGSTAAQRSGGGKILPLTSTDLQLVVREPYTPAGEKLKITRALDFRTPRAFGAQQNPRGPLIYSMVPTNKPKSKWATSWCFADCQSRSPYWGLGRGVVGGNTQAERGVPFAPPALLLAAAALLFCAMALVAKVAAASVPGPEVAFVRFGFGLLVCALASLHTPLRPHNKVGLLLRGAYGGGAVLAYFAAIEHLPVGVATLLNYTGPVFTAVYAAVLLGESASAATVGALILTTLGVLMVLKSTAPPGALALGTWQWVGILSAALSGAAIATMRELRKTDGPIEIFVAFCVGGLLITALPTARHWVLPSAAEWPPLLAVAFFSVAAQLLLTYAIGFVRAALAGVLAQLTPLATIVIGWVAFAEPMTPLVVLGAGLTFAGVAWGGYLAGTAGRATLPPASP